MSAPAREESRSISENATWSRRKRFSGGKVTMPYMDSSDTSAPITTFDESLWNATVESLIVGNDGRLTFRRKDGSEIKS